MRNSLFVVLAIIGLFATQAMAQDYSNVYVGAGVGTTSLDTSVGISGGTIAADGDASTVFGFVGYSFNPFISIEGGITSTGKADSNGSTESVDVKASNSVDMRAFEVVAKGTLPIGKFELFARGGVMYGDTDYDLNLNFKDTTPGTEFNSPNRVVASYQDTGFILGLGAGYNFGRGAIRLQYDYTTLELGGTDNYDIQTSDGTNFSTASLPLTIKTDNPARLMLTVSGYF